MRVASHRSESRGGLSTPQREFGCLARLPASHRCRSTVSAERVCPQATLSGLIVTVPPPAEGRLGRASYATTATSLAVGVAGAARFIPTGPFNQNVLLPIRTALCADLLVEAAREQHSGPAAGSKQGGNGEVEQQLTAGPPGASYSAPPRGPYSPPSPRGQRPRRQVTSWSGSVPR